MDAGLTLRPVSAVTAEAGRTIAATPDRPVAATDLPQAKAVRPAGASSAAASDARPGDPRPGDPKLADPKATKAYIDVDPQTRDVIFRVVNDETKQVVDQFPDQSVLNARAYFRETARKEADAKPAVRTDFKA